MLPVNPEFPVYIVSKGRHESRLTVRNLERMGVPYRIVVEEQEYRDYAAVIDPAKILVLDKQYQRDYDPCDHLGPEVSKGSGPARNFAWDHSVTLGAARHWVMDDNHVRGFFRFDRNLKVPVADGTIFRCMEDFVSRYRNIGMAGPNDFRFAARKTTPPPYTLNTRIYSCILIQNDLPFRWRARFNEDADLSLRMLKAGLCTVQFNAFLQDKANTQTVKGGNTELYKTHGTLAKSRLLVALHPDVAKVVWRFSRWHHVVDYSSFKANKLILAPGVEVPREPNNYGMTLRQAA